MKKILFLFLFVVLIVFSLQITAETNENHFSYEIKKGDCLSKIAKKFDVALDYLLKINDIANADYIRTGEKLKIPNSQKNDYQLMSRHHEEKFIWPCQGIISSNYGWRTHPIYKKKDFHKGIDIALGMGNPIYAVKSGVVIYSGWKSGYGRIIKIQHRNGEISYYAHNLKLLVQKGDTVKQGKIIALSGNSGQSTGPHLHFEIRIDNKHINPLRYLNVNYLKRKI